MIIKIIMIVLFILIGMMLSLGKWSFLIVLGQCAVAWLVAFLIRAVFILFAIA